MRRPEARAVKSASPCVMGGGSGGIPSLTRRRFITATATVLLSPFGVPGAEATPPFQHRGYYLCFMRMPAFGLDVWREILDGAATDGANTIILWRDAKCSGYVPSLECYSYVPPKAEFGEPWLVGKRQVPFGFGWLKEGENPYRELPVRAIRLAYRELTANPDLADADLRVRLGRELFGANWQPAQVDDLFELFRVFNTDRDWSVPGALTTPGLVRDRAERGKLDAKKRTLLRDQLARVRAIAARHRDATSDGAMELHRIAQWHADQWVSDYESILNSP